jgi:hypothetical protein
MLLRIVILDWLMVLTAHTCFPNLAKSAACTCSRATVSCHRTAFAFRWPASFSYDAPAPVFGIQAIASEYGTAIDRPKAIGNQYAYR